MPASGRPSREARAHESLARAVVEVLSGARQEAGLSRRELAARSGVSANTIIKIERSATTDPGFTVVMRLAQALGVDLNSVVQRAHEATVSSPRIDESPSSDMGVVSDSGRPREPESEP